jgi:hypothetical protein
MNAPQKIAGIGDNLPPNDAEILRATLAERHRLILDGAARLIEAAARIPERIDDEETAAKVTDYIKKVVGSRKNIESQRVGEKEPYLMLGRAVDGFFKGTTDALDGAKTAAQRKLDAWLRKKADEERKRRIEEADRIRRQAEEEATAAALLDSADMRPQADKMLDQAATTEKAAQQVALSAHDRPAHLAQSRGETGATASLRTRWVGEIVSAAELDLNVLRPFLNPEALQKALTLFVSAGGRELKGARIYEKSESVVR